jgi:4-carboxymuconolactone decarboxylase
MRSAASDGSNMSPVPIDEYKHHLRRLAVHDEALLEAIAAERSTFAAAIDARTAALVRVAATIAVDAAPSSFQHAVALALAAGATSDQIVASLEAVTPVTGAARVVQCAPKVALALGYDVDAALEQRDRDDH